MSVDVPIKLTKCEATLTTVTFTAEVHPDPTYVASFVIDDLRSLPHPCGVDFTHAEVRRVFESEWIHVATEDGDWLDAIVRIAVSLGARAPGALRSRLHGPVRPLDGSTISDNPTPWRPRCGDGEAPT